MGEVVVVVSFTTSPRRGRWAVDARDTVELQRCAARWPDLRDVTCGQTAQNTVGSGGAARVSFERQGQGEVLATGVCVTDKSTNQNVQFLQNCQSNGIMLNLKRGGRNKPATF